MRKQSGLNLDELSQKANVPKGTLSKISAGITKTPSLETMRSLVHAMGYTLDDLEDENSIKHINNHLSNLENNLIQKYRALDEHGKKVVNLLIDEETARMKTAKKEIPASTSAEIIPLPQSIQSASAGYGDPADGETAEIVYVYRNNITAKADYIMTVDGKSMEPKFFDGQQVLVRQQPAVEIGEIGIFIKEGMRFIKIYRGDHMESANPNYKDEPFEEYSKCMGKVLGILQDDWIVKE